MFTFKP
jgi:hypothetical protein